MNGGADSEGSALFGGKKGKLLFSGVGACHPERSETSIACERSRSRAGLKSRPHDQGAQRRRDLAPFFAFTAVDPDAKHRPSGSTPHSVLRSG